MMNFAGKNVLILGAGREGKATMRYMQQIYPNTVLTIADQQHVEGNFETAQTAFGAAYPSSLDNWDVVIVSPGIPPHTPLLQSAKQITTATNIFLNDCRGMTVGVTGSKGKSTISSLITSILKQAQLPVQLVGNIGTPALDSLLESNTAEDIFIFEMSSYQTSRLEHGPDIALINNLFPEHLDYHGSVDTYYTDKLRITTTQTADQLAVFNADNTALAQRITASPAQKLHWPATDGAHISEGTIYFGKQKIMSVKEVPLLGKHNVENVLAAITVAKQFNVDAASIQQAIQQFTPLPHRLELVGTFHGIHFYDDSISTTPESTIAAIESIEPIGTLFLGGMDRGYNFAHLAKCIATKKIPNIVFMGASSERIKDALKDAQYAPNMFTTDSMEEAVQFAYDNTVSGQACVLSCASPSYGLFKNFEDRGDQFKEAVHELL